MIPILLNTSPALKQPLTRPEISALLSASESGQINAPCGTAMEIDAFVKVMRKLERRGLVSRKPGDAYYRPFHLTEQGIALKAQFANRGETISRGVKQPPAP